MLFVLILLNLIVITSTTGSWHQLDGIEYYFEYTAVSGAGANAGCKRMNAILAAVKSQRIQDFLVKNINTTKLTGGPYSFYIGLSRTGPNILQWSDGKTTNTSVFTYWDVSDDVYDSSKLCVTMGYHAALNVLFKWKIEPCSATHRYICQKNTTTTITTPEPTTTERSFTSKETPTTEYKEETTFKNNHATMGNLKSCACKTPSWVIPIIAILSASLVFMLALVLYLWKRLSQSTVRTCNIKDNVDMTQASGHITPYATTSGYQQQYENLKATETAYEEFNGK
uniref:chondrolectin-like isoform X2 n=1 Tax=Ciona intestinalis TaxID=7719 RepID=UPI000EF48470|nr:chondrolectin-like isoform X2 [Ciona intestinalis]|eukprot:XP_026695369.1 chondrolectin-like isoform X2 [Ciona intestinalis]